MRKKYLHLLSWSLGTWSCPRPLQPPACPPCCLCRLSPGGKGTSGLGRPSCSPTTGTLCSSRSTESFQLTVTSFSEILFGFKVTEDCSPWGPQRCSKFLSQRWPEFARSVFKRHNNTTIVLGPQMQKLKSSDIKQSWKSHRNMLFWSRGQKFKNPLPKRVLVS